MTENKLLNELSTLNKFFFILSNFFPLVLTIISIIIFIYLPLGISEKTLVVLTLIYLVPPLLARIILFISPIINTRIKIGSKEFVTWWFIFCLQSIFLRFSFLEEFIRLIPSAYSMWLRLWGAKVGKLAYWTAGTTILDRPFLNIGNYVSFGAGVRLNPHVIVQNEEGERELLLAPITIGDNVIVGGYSLLTSGTEIADNECTKAFLISPPFSKWKNNKRVKE